MEKIFGAKPLNNERVFSAIQKISTLSDEISKKTKEMKVHEYSIVLENKNDYYISLADFLKYLSSI